MEECVEADRPCRRVGRTHRNHLDLEVLYTAAVPCLARRVPLQETEQAKALHPTDVKPRGAHRRAGHARQQHVDTERLVAALGQSAVGEELLTGARTQVDAASLPHSPISSDFRSFFCRLRPTAVQSCGDARRSHARRPPSRQSRARSTGAAHAPQCVPTAPPRQ